MCVEKPVSSGVLRLCNDVHRPPPNMLASSRQGPTRKIPVLFLLSVPFATIFYAPGAPAGCNKPLRTLCQTLFSAACFFSHQNVCGDRCQGCGQLLSVPCGPGAVLGTLIALLENHIALKTRRHSAADDKHQPANRETGTEGSNSAFRRVVGREVPALRPGPSAFFFTSFLDASPGWGCICSSPAEDCLWAVGAVLPAGAESGKFIAPLRPRI